MKAIWILLFIGTFSTISLNAADESQDKKHRGHKQADFSTSDKNNDAKLSKEEFVAAQNQRLEKRFKKLDKDGDGFLSKEEFAAAPRHKK